MTTDEKVRQHPPQPSGHYDDEAERQRKLAAQAAHMAHLGHASHIPQPAAHPAPHPHEPAHAHSHAHPHPHPHPHPHHAPAEPEGMGWGKGLALALGLVALLGGAWWAYDSFGPPDQKPEEQLVEQMQAAAAGTAVPVHALGGPLKVGYDRGLVVIASGLTSKACVSAGWRLSKSGVISINGFTPNRLSAAKLSELCGAGDTATLSWRPNPNGAG